MSRGRLAEEIREDRSTAYRQYVKMRETAEASQTLISGGLHLEDAIKLGIQNNKTLMAAIEEKAVARGKVIESYSQVLPMITAQGTYRRLDEVSSFDVAGHRVNLGALDNYSVDLSVTQPLFRGGAIRAALRSARLAELLSDEQVREAMQQTIYSVARAYYDAVLFQHQYEVNLAVIAATSSIAAVFIPVAFMKGMIGRFFFQFGVTVAVTIVISAMVSLTLTPMLCSRLLKHQERHNAFYDLLERGFRALESFYRRTLGWVVAHRGTTVLIAFIAFGVGIALVPFIGKEFVTSSDEGRFIIRFELPTGTSIFETEKRLWELERILFSQPEVKHAFTGVGMGGGREVNQGMMFVVLKPKGERKVHQKVLMRRLRNLLAQYKDMKSSGEYISILGEGRRNTDIKYIIQGPTVRGLAEISNRIVKILRKRGGFVDVDTDLRITKPEVKVFIDRNLADDLGVDVRTISENIYILFGGVEAAKFKEGGERFEIRVRALPFDRDKPQDLYRVSMRAQDGRLVKAPNLLKIEVSEGPNVVNRFNRMRSVTLYTNLEGKPMGEALAELDRITAELLPKDGRWGTETTGRTQAFRESFLYMGYALMVAILIIYMILAAQFESFIHPFTVLLSLPLCIVGVFGLLLITGNTLNIYSYLGVIMLVAIVTKNAILLVDYANTLRGRGMGKVEAMLQAGPTRFRPILMTAASTIIGILPVALALSTGGESRAPMAVAVIGGMLTSTFLTLLVIPVVYLLMDDLSGWLRRRFFGSAEPVAAAGGETGSHG